MTLTDGALMIAIMLFLAWALIEDVLLPRRHGFTVLTVPLQRRNRLDSLIFIGLLAILLWQNLSRQGLIITTSLILMLAFVATWIFWWRRPHLLFKSEGFYYGPAFIHYARIQALNLSEDGILVMQLEKRRLLIQVQQLDDLERIWQLLSTTSALMRRADTARDAA